LIGNFQSFPSRLERKKERKFDIIAWLKDFVVEKFLSFKREIGEFNGN
jgi:hypothetical protein